MKSPRILHKLACMNLVLEFLHSLQVQQLTQTAQQQAHQPHLMPNLQSQTMTSVPLSMTMAANPNTVNPGTIRNQLGQLPQVHVIHQPMHSPSYLPQYTYNQQQLMLQNMQGKSRANQERGGWVLSFFSAYVGSGSASAVHAKNIRNFKHPQKIFEILATPKNIPHSVP